MEIQIIKPGILSTIQDLGRTGYRDAGLPLAGAMDRVAAAAANLLAGNEMNAAVIEVTLGDFECIATSAILIACSGSGAALWIDEINQPFWKTIFVPAGSHIRLVNDNTGCRSYIAVAGGWKTEKILGSFSTYIPVHIGQPLGKLQLIRTGERRTDVSKAILQRLQSDGVSGFSWGIYPGILAGYGSDIIRIIAGLEYDWFDESAHQLLLNNTFTSGLDSGRMGIYIDGAVFNKTRKEEMFSTAVAMGTIQVTNGGRMVLLMADCQTTGGYPRIAQVAAVDLPICAQLKPGDGFHFRLITNQEAEELYVDQQKKLELLRQQVASLTSMS